MPKHHISTVKSYVFPSTLSTEHRREISFVYEGIPLKWLHTFRVVDSPMCRTLFSVDLMLCAPTIQSRTIWFGHRPTAIDFRASNLDGWHHSNGNSVMQRPLDTCIVRHDPREIGYSMTIANADTVHLRLLAPAPNKCAAHHGNTYTNPECSDVCTQREQKKKMKLEFRHFCRVRHRNTETNTPNNLLESWLDFNFMGQLLFNATLDDFRFE